MTKRRPMMGIALVLGLLGSTGCQVPTLDGESAAAASGEDSATAAIRSPTAACSKGLRKPRD